MKPQRMRIVILGLSMTSSWGNGHATTFRGLVRRGHHVLFLERDVPWYASNRDMPRPPWGRTELYTDLEDLHARFTADVRDADLVVVGSYVPQGVDVGRWVQATARGIPAFYDIDTPVTLAKLARGDFEYLAPEPIPGYRLYLSFTGGPHAAAHRARAGLARSPPAVLRRGPGAVSAPHARAGVGPGLPGDVQRGPVAHAGATDAGGRATGGRDASSSRARSTRRR